MNSTDLPNRISWWQVLPIALVLFFLGPAFADEEPVLNVYNWSDYIGEDTIRNFERETGIKVNYDNYDGNEVLHAKLLAGHTGYDIVVPSSHWAGMQIQANLFRPLDKSLLHNLGNLDPVLTSKLSAVDPGHQYLVGWLWGYASVGIDVDRVRDVLGLAPLPANAWDLVFRPEYASKLKSCGISFLDSADDVIRAALRYLGKPQTSRDPADYQQALALLRRVRPYIAQFSSAGYSTDLAKGSVCVALGWSGDFNTARERAKESRTGHSIRTLVPSTGGLLFFDVMAIPRDAPHPRNAHRWIDYILRPEVAAGITNQVLCANPNRESRRFVRRDLAADATLFLSADDLAKMAAPPESWDNEIRRLQARAFQTFKAGN